MILNMAAVCSQVHRDGVGPSRQHAGGGVHDRGLGMSSRRHVPVAGLPQGGYVVDVDTKK